MSLSFTISAGIHQRILSSEFRGTHDDILLPQMRDTPQPGVRVFISPSKSVARLTTKHVATDGQLASLAWYQAPIWGLRPDFYYCRTVAGLLMWGALSDERTGPSFAITAGPRQVSHSRVRVPWDS
jgi:hypothetical protein